MRAIWKKSDIDASKEYVFLLFDNGAGVRDFGICERSLSEERAKDKDCVFLTQVVPIDLVLRGDVFGISEQVKLSNGEPFYFNSNGVWLTKDEWDDLGRDSPNVRWVRGCAPLSPSSR